MEILIWSGGKDDLILTNSELPTSCLIGEYTNTKLLEAQEICEGLPVIIKAESYMIRKREYPLCNLYGLKAVSTNEGIVPLLRLAKKKERTITQYITRDRFGQADI